MSLGMMKYEGRVRVAVVVASLLAVVGLFALLNVKSSAKDAKVKAVRAAKQNIHKLKVAKDKAPTAASMNALNRIADEVADARFLDELLELTPEAACHHFVVEFGVKGVMIIIKHIEDVDGDHLLPKFMGAPKVIAEHAEKQKAAKTNDKDEHAALLHHHHHFMDDKHVALFCKTFQAPEVGRTIRLANSIKYPDDRYIIEMIQ